MINDAVTLDATDCYKRLTDDEPPIFRIFKWYMRLHVPKLFIEEPPVHAPDLKRMTKRQFFDALIDIASDPEPLAVQLARLIKLRDGSF